MDTGEIAIEMARGDLTENQLKVAKIINDIPRSTIISYGDLTRWVNNESGLNLQTPMVAKTRKKLYGLLRKHNRQFDLPLHRIAKKGDVKAKYDSPKTQKEVKMMRTKEGSWENPKWFKPTVI